MIKELFFVIILVSLISCNESKKQQIIEIRKPELSIDTTRKGNIGKPESSIVITTRLDTTIIKRISKYWVSKTEVYERFEFFDSLANKYKQVDYSSDKKGFKHSYVWYDTLKEESSFAGLISQSIARTDSSFKIDGKLQNVEQRFGETELTKYFNNNNVVFKKRLYSKSLDYSYLQNGNEFYKIRNDIPIEYAEWVPTTKTDFGLAIKIFYDEKIISENRFKELYKIFLE